MSKAKILVVEDEKLIGWSLQKELTQQGFEVLIAATAREGLGLFFEEGPDAVLLDIRLPDGDGKEILKLMRAKDPLCSVIMVTANEEIRTAVECMHEGAFHYLHKPFDFEELLSHVERAVETRQLRKKMSDWEFEQRTAYDFSNLVAESSGMKAVVELLHQIVDSDASTVLIEGESGTGKDLVARTLHFAGRRSAKPFVAVNCAAIPGTLLESELFGHEKGAFTDAKQSKKGLVEEAAGGTLFLDEIGDMPKELQAKLLHLIDQKKFRKVGGLKEMEAEVRIIAATNKDLKAEVNERRFREDLYYRLKVIPFSLPPLRERRQDIPALAGIFMAQFNKEFRKEITGMAPAAMEILMQYEWPGNVRELRNVIERAMILNRETLIRPEHLPSEIQCHCVLTDTLNAGEKKTLPSPLPFCLAGIPLEAIEEQAIVLALESTQGNQSQAARLLGIGRDALRYKMQKFGLMSLRDSEAPAERKASV